MATINGTPNNDVITGTTVDDIIDGGAGNDRINGGAGNDLITGGLGSDALTGDAGNDTMYGGDGNDAFYGGGNDDTLYGENGDDTMNGDGGNDVLFGGAGNDILNGGTGNDTLNGGAGVNVFNGGSGLDTVVLEIASGSLNAAMRSDLAALKSFMDAQLASAGSTAALSTQTAGATLQLAALGVTISNIESVKVLLDGVETPITSLINRAPTADTVVAESASEDVVFTGSVSAADADGDVLAYAVATGPAHGALALDAVTGQYTYTPGENFNGADSFEVMVADPSGALTTQTVNVGVAAVNDAPVVAATTVAIATNEDTAITGAVVASDVDGDVLGYAVATGPAHGALALDATTGQYTYTPGANFSGADVFSVQVTDGAGASTSQTINVSTSGVADAPTLTTVNQTIALSGSVQVGTRAGETIVAAAGVTHILGAAGNDTILAGNAATVTTSLGIAAALQDRDGSENLTLQVSGMPAGSQLSAGQGNADGSWTLTGADLVGLTITAPTLSDITLHVAATSTEVTGGSSIVARDLTITFDRAAAPNIIEGGSGSDSIFGGANADVIYGGSMPKGTVTVSSIASEKDNDIIHGGDGNDTIYGQKGNDQLFGENGDDYLSGGKGDDLLYGGLGHNTIKGDSGNDTIFAQGGDDTISGGTGFDTLDFSLANRGLTIDVSKGTALGFNTAAFSSIEKIVGSSFADDYKGSSVADIFLGGAGDDVIRGLGGADTLTGGSGRDTFVYMGKDAGAVDHITDFAVGDRLDLHDFLKSAKYASIGDVVHVHDSAAGSTVSIKTSVGFVDLVVLDGVHGTTAQDLLSHGMILA